MVIWIDCGNSDMSRQSRWILVAIMGALAGCAGYAPPTSGPTAILRIVDNGGLTYLDTDNSCKTKKMVREENVAIRADRPIWIEQRFSATTVFAHHTCEIRLMFTPEVGASYEAELVGSFQGCQTNLYRIDGDGAKIPQPFARSKNLICLFE